MKQLLLSIDAEFDIIIVRQAARQYAEQIGFDSLASSQIELGVSEIVRNVIRYGVRGTAKISNTKKNRGLKIVISDQGNGFEDIQKARQEGFSTTPNSLGLGLSVAERAFDQFRIDSIQNKGATITLEKYLPFNQNIINYGSVSMKDDGYLINGDALLIKEFDGDKILVAVIDGAGQGKLANEISSLVLQTIEQNYRSSLDQIVYACDKNLRNSHLEGGATIAIALISSDHLAYIGVGDSHSYYYSEDQEIEILSNQEGRLGEFHLPALKVRNYKLSEFANIILCTDGINTQITDSLPAPNTPPQFLANYIFNTYHRTYGDATVLVAQYQPGLL